jgi:hypothetical protein
MGSTGAPVAVVTLLVIMGVVVWIDARCLADLRRTTDRELRHFDRATWALIIVVTFPVGPALYLTYGRGPGRPV